jgi:PKD repeat protein
VFVIPSYADAGAWNVTVTNPDGQSGKLMNGFSVINTTATTQPTTTATTAPPAPTVSSITPSSAITGMQVNITNLAGSNLLNVTSVKLTKSGQSDITATNVSIVSSSQMTGTINLAGAASGQWNVLVSNSAGQSGIGTNLFTVNPLPPVAAFTASPLTGNTSLNVAFTDLSTGSPTTWSWAFGDGNTSTSSTPVHTYVFAGDFSVSLTVTNAGGSNSTTQSNYITVT